VFLPFYGRRFFFCPPPFFFYFSANAVAHVSGSIIFGSVDFINVGPVTDHPLVQTFLPLSFFAILRTRYVFPPRYCLSRPYCQVVLRPGSCFRAFLIAIFPSGQNCDVTFSFFPSLSFFFLHMFHSRKIRSSLRGFFNLLRLVILPRVPLPLFFTRRCVTSMCFDVSFVSPECSH